MCTKLVSGISGRFKYTNRLYGGVVCIASDPATMVVNNGTWTDERKTRSFKRHYFALCTWYYFGWGEASRQKVSVRACVS
jgi:hypothetical protein